MKTIAVFSNKGGVGKTSLVYHLAWMYARLDYNVLVADLDPQANLTTMFLSDDELERLWEDSKTVDASLRPLLAGTGDVTTPHVVAPTSGIGLVAGDMALSGAEDELSSEWPACLDGKERAFRVLSAIWRTLQMAAKETASDFLLLDVGPNLGALNRAALVAADHAVRLDRPVKAYGRWMTRIPDAYRVHVLDDDATETVAAVDDCNCLATLKHFRSLMPLAQEARKPMFALKPADGAIGGHANAVRGCYRDFRALARTVARRCEVTAAGA